MKQVMVMPMREVPQGLVSYVVNHKKDINYLKRPTLKKLDVFLCLKLKRECAGVGEPGRSVKPLLYC